MKSLVLALALMVSTSSFARQYIQCSIPEYDSTDVMVVNLQTETTGTLFLSSGMQNPDDERVLVDIQFEKIENGDHVFKVVHEEAEGRVFIPSFAIGKSVDKVEVDLNFIGYSFTYSCFARIYND